ncbi:hypothetical protein BDD12DRAFT_805741 [Trichophaea hybrida]|nr:hypothetical protein BDD12DRAFT_805741 [Trichophaea hybrida]
MRACTVQPVCIIVHSLSSSPPQPHTSNNHRDSDENNYYSDVHDGSHIHLELPPSDTLDEMLSTAETSMNKVRDIDNYEDNIPANTYTAENHPDTDPKSSLGCHGSSPMMTPMTMRWSLMTKGKYTQADPSDSSWDADEGATFVAILQRKLKGMTSGSNNHSKMAWAVVVCTREYFEYDERKRYQKDYPGLVEKIEISSGIAKQMHNLKDQLH